MRAFLKFLVFLLVLAVLVGGIAWFWAGRSAGPTITIRQPGQFVGQNSSLELMAEAPEGKFTSIDVTVEQAGKTFPVFTLDQPQGDIRQETAERLYVMRPVGKKALPDLESGPARIVVRASRPVLYGLRSVSSTTTHDVRCGSSRRRSPCSRRSTTSTTAAASSSCTARRPADVVNRACASATRSIPATRQRASGSPATRRMRVAFFALLFDQDARTPRCRCSRATGGQRGASPRSTTGLREAVSEEPHRDRRSLPAARGAGHRQQLAQEKIPTDDLLAGFLKINGDLRRKNNQYLAGSGEEVGSRNALQGCLPATRQLAGRSQVR